MTATPQDPPVTCHFIGNATLLISYGDVTLLTDPNFLHRGQHAYLGYGLTTRRLREPTLRVADLPADIDAIVLSHLHGDHWDRVARRGLDSALPVLTTPQAARRLRHLHGFPRATALETWQSRTVTGRETQVRVTSLPGQHAGGPLRPLFPQVMGSLLEFGPLGGPPVLRLYLSGDTLPFPHIVTAITRRCPDLDLAVLHLGGTTLPGGFLVTMTGNQGAGYAERLDPEWVLPVHYEEYTVMKSPLSEFIDAVRRRGLGARLVPCARGERVALRPGGRPVVEAAPVR